MAEQLGDAPIEPQHENIMTVMAKVLDEVLNGKVEKKHRKYGFCLMIFPFNEGAGRCNYISTANREDVIVLLKEQLKRFEGQPDITGRA